MKIAAYVIEKQIGRSYSNDNHDKRAWPGFEMVLDAIRRAGYEHEYAGRATIHEFDIVLVSITSDCDWWPFIAECVKWRSRPNQLVIAGGAGVLNVRPFLQWIDAFVIGRGECILPAIIAAHEKGERYESASVVWSDSFSVNNCYQIAQTDIPYPHPVHLTNGKVFNETSIGCYNKCLFCAYTWHRKHIGHQDSFDAGAAAWASKNSHIEKTMQELLNTPSEKWNEGGALRIVGLDGMSERLRIKANKRITRAMLLEFFSKLSEIKPSLIKLYVIAGYPTETKSDWREFLEDLQTADNLLKKRDKLWGIHLQITPFRAFPATPAACWPMSFDEYRGAVCKFLKKQTMSRTVFFEGNAFWAYEGGTSSAASTILTAICFRGDETDSDTIQRVALSKPFWAARSKDKRATLEKHFDLEKLGKRYTWETVPTRYLKLRKHGE